MKKDDKIKFYSVVLRKSVMIPKSKCKKKEVKGRLFLVGDYKANGKDYKAWKIVGSAKNKKK